MFTRQPLAAAQQPHVRLADADAGSLHGTTARVTGAPSSGGIGPGPTIVDDPGSATTDLSNDGISALRLAMRAVPSSIVNHGSRAGRGRSRAQGRVTPLVRDGAVISKVFNISAARPMPNFTSLEQSIRVTITGTTVAAFVTSAANPTYQATSFSLNNFGVASYLGLFDQYRIDQIEVWITANQVNVNAAIPELATAVDLDDANTPTSFSIIQNKQGSITTGGEAGHYHRWKPHMAVALYGGAFTSYGNVVADWIDSASPAVEHYGLKLASTAATTVMSYALEYRAVVSFRGPSIP